MLWQQQHAPRSQSFVGLEMVNGGHFIDSFAHVLGRGEPAGHKRPERVATMHDDPIVTGGAGRENLAPPKRGEGKNKHEGQQLNEGNQAAAWHATTTIHGFSTSGRWCFEHMFAWLDSSPVTWTCQGLSNRRLHLADRCGKINQRTVSLTAGASVLFCARRETKGR